METTKARKTDEEVKDQDHAESEDHVDEMDVDHQEMSKDHAQSSWLHNGWVVLVVIVLSGLFFLTVSYFVTRAAVCSCKCAAQAPSVCATSGPTTKPPADVLDGVWFDVDPSSKFALKINNNTFMAYDNIKDSVPKATGTVDRNKKLMILPSSANKDPMPYIYNEGDGILTLLPDKGGREVTRLSKTKRI